jgi:hypothetical protein
MAELLQQVDTNAPKLIKFPLPLGDKQIPGYILVAPGDKKADGKWFYERDTTIRDGQVVPIGVFGEDYSTFQSIKGADGKYTAWRASTKSSIPNLANRTGLSTQQIDTGLWKTPTVQTKLNQARVAILNGPNSAAKLDPKIPGVTNVDPAAGGAAAGGAAAGGGATGADPATSVDPTTEETIKKSLEIGAYRKEYGNLRYPLDIKLTQDCVRFEMWRYVPKSFNPNSSTGTGTAASELLIEVPDTAAVALGSVILPIQSPISDTNTVKFLLARVFMYQWEPLGLSLHNPDNLEG